MFFEKQSRKETSIAVDDRKGLSRAWARFGTLMAAVMLASSLAVLAGCSSSQQSASSASSASSAAVASSSSSSSASSGESQQAAVADDEVDTITVNVTVNASAVQEEGWDAYLRGINGPLSLPQGATAYDALMATDADIVEEGGYVTSIDGLRTGQFGTSSGWMYSVNDENPFVAANDYQLQDGDSVRWYYTR